MALVPLFEEVNQFNDYNGTVLAAGASGVRGTGSLERELGGDLEEGLDLRLAGLDGGE